MRINMTERVFAWVIVIVILIVIVIVILILFVGWSGTNLMIRS